MLIGYKLELLDKAIEEHNGVWYGSGDCLITSGQLNVYFAVGEKFDFVTKGSYIAGYWDYLCSKDQYLQRAKELGYPKGESSPNNSPLQVSYTPHLGRWWDGAKLLAEENGFVVFTREGRDKPIIRKRSDVLFRDPPTELEVLIDEALKEMGYYMDEMGYYGDGCKTPDDATYAVVKQMIELGYRKGAD